MKNKKAQPNKSKPEKEIKDVVKPQPEIRTPSGTIEKNVEEQAP